MTVKVTKDSGLISQPAVVSDVGSHSSVFWLKMMSGWEPPDAAFLSFPLKTLMDENALWKFPPSLQTSLPHHMMYVLYQVCR